MIYKNIFIYLTLATTIHCCRGSIRTKRIAEAIKNDNNVDGLKDSLSSTSKLTIDSEASRTLRSPIGINSRSIEGSLEGLSLSHFTSEFQHKARTARDLNQATNMQQEQHGNQHLTTNVNEGDDAKSNKEKENLVAADADEKVPERGLSDSSKDDIEKVGSSKFYESNEHGRFERSAPRETHQTVSSSSSKSDERVMLKGRDNHDMDEQALRQPVTKLRQLRNAKKRDGRLLESNKLTSSPSTDDLLHAASATITANGDKKLLDGGDAVHLESHKRDLKPDMDVYLYSNIPSYYNKQSPMLLEMYNNPSSFYQTPYKWLQRRSPIQSALEIANMMVKVGLDEMDSDDYGEHSSFLFESNPANKGSNHKFDRAISSEANFCPVHARKTSLNGGGIGELDDIDGGNQRFGECLCSFTRRSVKEPNSKSDEVERTKRNWEHHEGGSNPEEHSDLKHLSLLKPF